MKINEGQDKLKAMFFKRGKWVLTLMILLISGSNLFAQNNKVWPGDADNNGKVGKRDVLMIGVSYGATGAARTNASIDWNGQDCDNWSKSFKNGVNFKNADCNGDGIIDANDLDAINTNWSNDHKKTEETTQDGNPDLYLVANHDTIGPNDTLILQIYLGTFTNPVSNVYGVSFTHQFASGVLSSSKPVSLIVNTENCWLYNSGGAVMPFMHLDYENQRADVAITRTNGTSVSGYGQIGEMIISPDNLGGKFTPPLNGQMVFSLNDIELISNDGSPLKISTKPITVYYSNSNSGIKSTDKIDAKVDIYPNPLKGRTLTIHLNDLKVEKTEIVDMLGNAVFTSANLNGELTELTLPDLGNGLYFVRMTTKQGIVSKKLTIIN